MTSLMHKDTLSLLFVAGLLYQFAHNLVHLMGVYQSYTEVLVAVNYVKLQQIQSATICGHT
jgi:hypothetical protein